MTLKPALILLLALPLAANAADGPAAETSSAAELFLQANHLYLAGEELTEKGDEDGAAASYEDATGIYEQLLDAGFAAPPLYYNLGNTYARLQRWGDAIWCYRNSLRLAPRDAE